MAIQRLQKSHIIQNTLLRVVKFCINGVNHTFGSDILAAPTTAGEPNTNEGTELAPVLAGLASSAVEKVAPATIAVAVAGRPK